MLSRVVTVSCLIAVAVLLPTSALGKGASEATITGPGLHGPLTLDGEGRLGGEKLMAIAEQAGFFPAVFSQTPDPMLDERPAGVLGPKYTIEYAMPGPNGEEDTLVQELYPYATPSPLSHVEPGQAFWTTEQTRGGWFVGTAELKDRLVAEGLPQTAPASGEPPSDSPWTVLGPIAALIAVIVAGALGAMVLMRRQHPPQPA